MDNTNYKLTNFGLYVPSYIADQIQHVDITAVALYEDYLNNAGKAESTVEKYTRFIQLFVSFLGDRYLSVYYVRKWLESMKTTHHINTVNNAISALNGFFKWLGRSDCVVSFYPYQEPQYRKDDRYLEKADFDRLLESADDRIKTMLLTFYGTGIRVGELRFFTVENVRTGQVLVDNKGKIRNVFLDPETKSMILDYCKRHNIKSGVVFCNKKGEALSRSYIWRCMKNVAKEADVVLSKVFPHNLRHLFAIERYNIDGDIDGLRLDLGHSNVTTTQRYLKESAEKHFERVMKRKGKAG